MGQDAHCPERWRKRTRKLKEIVDGLSLDVARGCLMRGAAPVHLRPLSYEVLKYLVDNEGRLVGKEELIEQVWHGRAVTDGSIGKCIEEVRAAIGAGGKQYVRTVRGRGYIFDPSLAETASASVPRRRTMLIVAAAALIVIVAVIAGAEYAGVAVRTGASASLADQYFQNGLFYRRKGGVENARKALEYFERAVAANPRFAKGWAAVARANLDFAGNSFEPPRPRIDAARATIEKALALDERLADAHVTLGLVEQSDWHWTEAERQYQRAIALDPDLVAAHRTYALYLSRMGRHHEAQVEIQRARRLDPTSAVLTGMEGMLLGTMGRHDEGIELVRQATAAEGDVGHNVIGYIYIDAHRYDDAVRELREAIRVEGENTSVLCYLAYALAKSGRRPEAEAILSKLTASTRYVSPVELGTVYMGLGDHEHALRLLEEAYETRDLQMQFLKVDGTYDAVRSDPRYRDLMRRAGLPD